MAKSQEAETGPASDSAVDRGLFASLGCPRGRRAGIAGVPASLAAHAVTAGALLLLPLLATHEAPDTAERIHVVVYNPGPPPLPPLPLGTRQLLPKDRPRAPAADIETEPRLVAPSEAPRPDAQPEMETASAPLDQPGVPDGDPLGVPDGAKNGVVGGSIDGAPDGVWGGCPGCTGTDPVTDADQWPRPIRITQPEYPQEAFIKKIEGTVELEIVIDARGLVVRARVMKSIPLLDQAAIRTVYTWRFAPALKHGRPVASLALAPVKFKLL